MFWRFSFFQRCLFLTNVESSSENDGGLNIIRRYVQKS